MSDEKFDIRRELDAIEGNQEKLTEWAKEPSISDLKNDLEAADPAHKAQMTKIRKWNDLRDLTGDSKVIKHIGRSSVQPKMVRRQAEWRYSSIADPFLGTEKLIQVKPHTFEDGLAARQNELVLNHQFRTKINKVKFVNDLVRSAVDDGTVIIQTGWDRTTTKVKEVVPEYSFFPVQTEEQLQEFSQALEISQSNPREFETAFSDELKEAVNFYLSEDNVGNQPVVAQVTGSREVEVEKILVNKPTVLIHNPNNVIIDPSCQGDLDKAMFVVVSFEESKASLLKQTDRYKNLKRIDWDNISMDNSKGHETTTPQDFQFRDVSRKKVLVYEYWGYYDIEGKGELTPIVATWIGDVMIRMEKNPFPDQKLPFVLATYLPVKREMYGETDAELIEENQKIAGAVYRGMIDLLGKSANSQQGIPKGVLDPVNQRRYERGDNYEYNPLQGNPAQQFITHTFPEIPQSALTMLTLTNQDTESLTAVKSFNGGLSGEAYGKVAAGIKGMLNAQGIRELNILHRLAQAVVSICEKIATMNAAWLSEKEVVRITNAEYQADSFVEVVREDLAGNFDIIIDISTAEMDDIQATELSFMLQTMGPDMDDEMKYFIFAEIAQLKRMPELAEKLRTYSPKPSPQQEKTMELELRKLELEVAKLESEVTLNNAKAERELAIATGKIVDTRNHESGISHARDLEKQQAQARGNQDLQLQKAILTPQKPGEGAPDIAAGLGYKALSATLDDAAPTQPSGGFVNNFQG